MLVEEKVSRSGDREETNEEARLAVIGALQAWAPHMGEFTRAVVDLLAGGLREKDSVRRAHLRALAQVLSIYQQQTLMRPYSFKDTPPAFLWQLCHGLDKAGGNCSVLFAF